MDKDKTTIRPDNYIARRKRIKRIKASMIVIGLTFLILPTILCIIMFIKFNSLQKQVDELLKNNQYITASSTLPEKDNKEETNSDAIVYAAVPDNREEQIKEDSEINLNQTAEEKVISNETADTVDDQTEEEKKDQKYLGKKIYLTFDDGPSKFTDDILDILAEYNVKATFFVIGKTDENSLQMYKRIVEEGHTLGMHSYSHDYKYIYDSLENFDKDFTKLRNLLYDTTGYLPVFYRFPGGSGNNVSKIDMSKLIKYLNEKSITYFDWNVINGDATGEDLTQDTLYHNVINGVEKHTTSIVLMHDTDVKENSYKSLRRILNTLTEEGGTLLPLDETVTPIQHVKSGSSEQ